MNYRESILIGAREATRLHERLQTRHQIETAGGGIDVFSAALELKSTVIFRDLKGILGAYLNENGTHGIMVTTQRRLPIQRFTGAHEVGHMMLGHQPSIDGEEILGGQGNALDPMEIQANGFAGEFMAPKWLLVFHATKQGWNRDSMASPEIVYQLALRIGLSYEATRRSLANHSIIDQNVASVLRARQVKDIKRASLPTEYTPDDWYSDVWVLTEKDKGTKIEGHPDDLFVFKMKERSGAGYLWDIDALKKEGFRILTNRGVSPGESSFGAHNPEAAIGGDILREIIAGEATQTAGKVAIEQRRPWQNSKSIDQILINYDLSGKEKVGLPRVARKSVRAA